MKEKRLIDANRVLDSIESYEMNVLPRVSDFAVRMACKAWIDAFREVINRAPTEFVCDGGADRGKV